MRANIGWRHGLLLGAFAAVVAVCTERPQAPDTFLAGTSYRLPYSTAFEFHLNDGTRCVAVSSSGGITCEWRK